MSEQQIQKVKVKRLAHVGLWTTDVTSQVRFYRQALGFDLRSTQASDQDVELEDANAFLTLGDDYHCLGLFTDTRATQGNGRVSFAQSRLHHLSFQVDTDAELAALAARLSMSGVDLSLEARDGDPDSGDTLWFRDPDGNRIEIAVSPDDTFSQHASAIGRRHSRLRPVGLQHLALQTPHLETMVEFYTESLGFDISDWLLRECAWLRCNSDHHTIILMQGNQDVDHVGYSIPDGLELLAWADHLGRQQVPILWGPGRHGAGSDLFVRFADSEGCHIELSAELQQYYDHDVTTPPRLWHTRPRALNLWGVMPPWVREEARV